MLEINDDLGQHIESEGLFEPAVAIMKSERAEILERVGVQKSSHRLLNRLFGQLLEGGECVFAEVVLAELLDVDLL